MLWNRVAFKRRGKQAFLRNYWKCFFVALMLSFLANSNFQVKWSGEEASLYREQYGQTIVDVADEGNITIKYNHLPIVVGTVTVVSFLAVIAAFLLDIFVFNMVEIGGCRFFINNAQRQGNARDLLYAFDQRHSYLNMVKVQLYRQVSIILWTCLFIVPGLIKSYEYYMVPYLLAENPDLSRKEALALSKQMMQGHKMDIFVLELSFIGWMVLSSLTLGLVGYFFVNPYIHATKAEAYLALTQQDSYFYYQDQRMYG